MAEAKPREPDPHAQARALLAARDLPIPASFAAVTVARMRESSDPRLVVAAGQAEDGVIAQYLAGAPELLARYRRAAPGPRAAAEALRLPR